MICEQHEWRHVRSQQYSWFERRAEWTKNWRGKRVLKTIGHDQCYGRVDEFYCVHCLEELTERRKWGGGGYPEWWSELIDVDCQRWEPSAMYSP